MTMHVCSFFKGTITYEGENQVDAVLIFNVKTRQQRQNQSQQVSLEICVMK